MSKTEQEKIEYPDFNKIIKECKTKMKQKFPEYGNSWHNIFTNDEFWKKRLNGEIKEIFKAKNSCEKKKEIVDAINILSMMFDLTDYECEQEDENYKRTWRYG